MARSRSASAPTPQPDPERPDDALPDRLPALRTALEQQHHFRREQLARLEGYGGKPEAATGADPADPAVRALREVDALLAAGARRALADIELALVRMHTGRYGYCRSCGATIPLSLLEAIPKTTLCLACRFRDERGPGQQGPRRTSPTTRRRRRRTDGSVSPARQRW